MNQQQIETLQTDTGETLFSHYRTTKKADGTSVVVPVIDVRDGISYRIMAYQMTKANNRSKYIQYGEYHRPSRKPQTII